MSINPWLDKAEKLARLAEAKRGFPEGDVAAAKLKLILDRHPEVRKQTLGDRPLLECDIELMSIEDIAVKAAGEIVSAGGIDFQGRWEGANLEQAQKAMLLDYLARARARTSARRGIAAMNPQLEAGK